MNFINEPLDIKYTGDILEIQTLFNEQQYIRRNFNSIMFENSDILSASKIDEDGYKFTFSHELDFLCGTNTLGYYFTQLEDTYYRNTLASISHNIRTYYMFDNYWHGNPLILQQQQTKEIYTLHQPSVQNNDFTSLGGW